MPLFYIVLAVCYHNWIHTCALFFSPKSLHSIFWHYECFQSGNRLPTRCHLHDFVSITMMSDVFSNQVLSLYSEEQLKASTRTRVFIESTRAPRSPAHEQSLFWHWSFCSLSFLTRSFQESFFQSCTVSPFWSLSLFTRLYITVRILFYVFSFIFIILKLYTVYSSY